MRLHNGGISQVVGVRTEMDVQARILTPLRTEELAGLAVARETGIKLAIR